MDRARFNTLGTMTDEALAAYEMVEGDTLNAHAAAIKAKDAEHQKSHADKDARHAEALAACQHGHRTQQDGLQAVIESQKQREDALKSLIDGSLGMEALQAILAGKQYTAAKVAREKAMKDLEAHNQIIAQHEG
jgi:hypothetical protein